MAAAASWTPPSRRMRHRAPDDGSVVGLRDVLADAVSQIAEAHGMRLAPAGTFSLGAMEWQNAVSILPFTGDHVSGTLLLGAPLPLLASTAPAGGADPEELLDWARELANLVLGGVKTTLLAQGIAIQIGVPTSVQGTELRVVVFGKETAGLVFERDGHALHVALDARFATDVVVDAPAARPAPSAQDLDTFLF